ncbi:MAG: S8 family serine peptidase, partial [Bacteroidota bacterium]
MKKGLLFTTFLFCLICATAQQNNLQGWHVKDKTKDGYYGISLEQAYQFLAAKKIKSTTVIVGVLDSGIDTAHEDLKPVLWTNSKEIPGNNKDDDGNGFADDVHGWNFLGNPDGRNVTEASSEWIRVYWRYKDKYEGKNIQTDSLSPAQHYEYTMWQKARSGVVGQGMNEEDLNKLGKFLQNVVFCDSVMKQNFAGNGYTQKDLAAYKPKTDLEKNIKGFLTEVFKQTTSPELKNDVLINDIKNYAAGEEHKATADKVPPEKYHLEITGDDETNLLTTHYGSTDIEAGTADHGTHVSGIIGAVRNNGMGMDGIDDNVRIMMVRTVPESDEYDKDIALGIRYAVDNGAKIISMSFGKSLSPDKKFIDDAVRYAASKDVLLVQGAGNSKRSIDAYDNFPNPKYFLTDSIASNWITVGASDAKGMAAVFSNYGVKAVDVFAPGVAIYSTFPGNKYVSLDGTSMATPVVSGLAALLRSYFPQLTAEEVKKIIEQSVVMPAEKTLKPGSSEKVMMNELCKSGGIINAFNAVKLAA